MTVGPNPKMWPHSLAYQQTKMTIYNDDTPNATTTTKQFSIYVQTATTLLTCSTAQQSHTAKDLWTHPEEVTAFLELKTSNDED